MSIENNKNYYKNDMNLKKENCTLFDFYELERLFRKGFMLNNVGEENCQSISEHIAAVTNLALLTMLEYNIDIDRQKVLEMLTIHEYGEIIIGDITPFDGITPKEKHEAEEKAICEIFKNLKSRYYLISLWNEFEKKETLEARFAYDMDKLEAAISAKRYVNAGKGDKEGLEKFYKFTMDILFFEESKDILKKYWNK